MLSQIAQEIAERIIEYIGYPLTPEYHLGVANIIDEGNKKLIQAVSTSLQIQHKRAAIVPIEYNDVAITLAWEEDARRSSIEKLQEMLQDCEDDLTNDTEDRDWIDYINAQKFIYLKELDRRKES